MSEAEQIAWIFIAGIFIVIIMLKKVNMNINSNKSLLKEIK